MCVDNIAPMSDGREKGNGKTENCHSASQGRVAKQNSIAVM